MKNKSFILRILIVFIITISLLLTVIYIFFFKNLEKESIKTLAKNLNNYCVLMDDEISSYSMIYPGFEFREFINEKSELLNARITIIDLTGKVIADSNENPAYMDNHLNRPEVIKAIEGHSNYVIRFSNTLRKNMMYFAYAYTLNNKKKIEGILRLSVFIDDIDSMVFMMQLKYIIAAFVLFFLSISTILAIYLKFKNEIRKFSGISYKVSDGDLNVILPKSDYYEIRELSVSYKKMIQKITRLISELKYEKDETERIVSEIKEGIAVFDEKGIIVRYNTSFQNLFGNSIQPGKHYWEIIRNNDLIDIMKNQDKNGNSTAEIEIDNKTFLCSISAMGKKNELVLIIYDLTEIKNIDRIKRDLVQNVSHELGTPLTAIKGYVETLLDEEKDDDRINYLNIIMQNTDRLNNITRDLLTLSNLERDARLEKKEVDLVATLNVVKPLFEEKMNKKGLRFSISTEGEGMTVIGDSFKLEQMLINLIDNAVKYTDRGEIKINLLNENGKVKIEIIDTGIGIPDQYKSQIFERFYVVDKSRSRSLGGTGLGLSIVKHIAKLHNATISVENNETERGTKFTVIFNDMNTI